jgi:hypothetical protein
VVASRWLDVAAVPQNLDSSHNVPSKALISLQLRLKTAHPNLESRFDLCICALRISCRMEVAFDKPPSIGSPARHFDSWLVPSSWVGVGVCRLSHPSCASGPWKTRLLGRFGRVKPPVGQPTHLTGAGLSAHLTLPLELWWLGLPSEWVPAVSRDRSDLYGYNSRQLRSAPPATSTPEMARIFWVGGIITGKARYELTSSP